MIDLDAIKKRCNAAMLGPWSIGKYGIGEWEVIPVARGCCWGVFADKADAEFIACARDDIPELVAEVERLRRQLERAAVLGGVIYSDDYDACFARADELKKQIEREESEEEG